MGVETGDDDVLRTFSMDCARALAREPTTSQRAVRPTTGSGDKTRGGAGAEMGQASRGANNAANSAIASRPCRTATLRAARPLGKGG